MRLSRLSTLSVSVLLAGLGLTACTSGSTADPAKAGGAAPVSGAPLAGQSAAQAPASSTTGTTASPGSGSSQADKCLAQNLKWTLTHLAEPGTGAKDPANAELVAVNSGSHGCTLAGFPKLEFHQGKGPEAHGVGQGSPAPVALGAGRKAVIALRYSELNGKGPSSGDCRPAMVTAGSVEVAAPGDGTGGVRVPVVDQSGRPTELTICGDEVRMSPPVAR